jgi:hypothetical protein
VKTTVLHASLRLGSSIWRLNRLYIGEKALSGGNSPINLLFLQNSDISCTLNILLTTPLASRQIPMTKNIKECSCGSDYRASNGLTFSVHHILCHQRTAIKFSATQTKPGQFIRIMRFLKEFSLQDEKAFHKNLSPLGKILNRLLPCLVLVLRRLVCTKSSLVIPL